jgi:predicted transcriptional regulator of viral defense system
VSVFEQFLRNHPVFTVEELDAFQQSRGSKSSATRKTILSRQEARGRVVRVRRGLYAAVPLGVSPEDAPVDPYLVASRLAPDAVLGYHTAAELHGKAYSVFREVQYLTSAPARPFSFRTVRFRPVRVPKALREKGAERYAVEVHKRNGLDVAVASVERTAVDLLDRLDLAGGFEEAWRFLEATGYLDLDLVVSYVEFLGNATTAAKVGYCLEELRDLLAVDPATLERLERLRPKSPQYIDRGGKTARRFCPRWQLVVPAPVAERAWEELTDAG